MAYIATDLAPASLVRSIEDNAADLFMEMGRLGGGEQVDEPALRSTIGGSPLDYHNCVVRVELSADEADDAIRRSLERMRARGVPGSWHVGPSARPADLGARLLAAGFRSGGTEPAMAADLRRLDESGAVPAGLRVARVRDEAELEVWAHTLAQGFGEGEREATWVADIFSRIGFDAQAPLRHYLAYVNERPVGTSTMYLSAGVAGIYFVMTVPEARRQGIGAAVTLAPLLEARDAGFRIGVLESSAAGRAVYARLGFHEYGTIHIYEWHDKTDT